jgi:hypothetical protein
VPPTGSYRAWRTICSQSLDFLQRVKRSCSCSTRHVSDRLPQQFAQFCDCWRKVQQQPSPECLAPSQVCQGSSAFLFDACQLPANAAGGNAKQCLRMWSYAAAVEVGTVLGTHTGCLSSIARMKMHVAHFSECVIHSENTEKLTD